VHKRNEGRVAPPLSSSVRQGGALVVCRAADAFVRSANLIVGQGRVLPALAHHVAVGPHEPSGFRVIEGPREVVINVFRLDRTDICRQP
jgi:hypothetical protein